MNYNLKPPKGAHKKAKRIGRGFSSGDGKTSGRGSKGQRAQVKSLRGLKVVKCLFIDGLRRGY